VLSVTFVGAVATLLAGDITVESAESVELVLVEVEEEEEEEEEREEEGEGESV